MSIEKRKNIKKPWPTQAAMEQVYELNLWGGKEKTFYSGDGSHNLTIVQPYMKAVKKFLQSNQKEFIICDLGCGDFNIGSQLVEYSKKYIAVDIVDELIEFNKKQHTNKKIEFRSLDIASDDLPEADCAIIRQVLQHLSNKEVEEVVKKLSQYKYVILTEHLPIGEFVPNLDIISGQGIRLKKKSGLDILKDPFNFKIQEETLLCSVELENNKGVIATKLYKVSN